MKKKNLDILLLPGDGIGKEISLEAKNLLDWISKNYEFEFALTTDEIGGAAVDKYGVPLTDQTVQMAQGSDAILLGAVGGPKWEEIPFEIRPERGLLKIRKELDLFANFRPAVVFNSLRAFSGRDKCNQISHYNYLF